MKRAPEFTSVRNERVKIFIFYQLIVGASRLMEAQMDLLRLLFGVGFQIFYIDASHDYVLVNMLRTCEAKCYYSLRRI